MGKRIVVGISGGIAAFKVAMLVSRLVQQGHTVSVALTASALKFVGEATFSALCGQDPVTESFDKRYPLGPHIQLVEGADLVIYAPATANLIGACAHGLASNLLSTMYLHAECPILMAPAMSAPMWAKAAVQRNVQQLRDDGVHLVGPEEGWLSCRRIGLGRMSEPDAILERATQLLEITNP